MVFSATKLASAAVLLLSTLSVSKADDPNSINNENWYYLYEGVAFLTVDTSNKNTLTTTSQDKGSSSQMFGFPNGIPGIVISAATSDDIMGIKGDGSGEFTSEASKESNYVYANYLDNGASISIYHTVSGEQTTYLSEPCKEAYSITSWNFTTAT